MHSSTFNSEGDRRGSASVSVSTFTITILCTVVLLLATAELLSFTEFDRLSKVQRREIAQRKSLLDVRDDETSKMKHVAVLGNSLMVEGIDVPRLKEQLDPKLVPVPYFVLGTEYYDWLFALKRLFAEGVRPSYIAIGLSPNQLVSSHTRGDYSARYLFRASDLLKVAQRTQMSKTEASEFILSHYSEYYATREIIRGFIQLHLMPSVAELLHNRLGSFRAPSTEDVTLRNLAIQRIRELNEICQSNGSTLILIVPPSYQKGADTIAQVGLDQGVTVLVPVANAEFDDSYYSDGFHLNQKGAEIFTARLAKDINQAILK
jgi:hypothetical protein